MADVSEERPCSTNNVESATATLFDTIKKLKKFQMEKRIEMLQLSENQKNHLLTRETHIQFEQLLENGITHQHSDPEDTPKVNVPEKSDIPLSALLNDSSSCDTLQESSITGHLERCFDDSAQSSVSPDKKKPHDIAYAELSLPDSHQPFVHPSLEPPTEYADIDFQGGRGAFPVPSTAIGNEEDSPLVRTSNAVRVVPNVSEKVPVFSEFRIPQFAEKNPEERDIPLEKPATTNDMEKPKTPFLKKGTGLLRYTPKSASSGRVSSNKERAKVLKAQLPQRTLKLKPSLRKSDAPSEHGKHIRFNIADSNDDENVEAPACNPLPSVSNEMDPIIHEENRAEQFTPSSACSSAENRLDTSNSESESLNLEHKELEEFEVLENCVQNNSFNSESSIAQRAIQGEPVKPSYARDNYSRLPSQNVISTTKETHVIPPKIPNFSEDTSLNKCLDEVQAGKKMLDRQMSDIHPRIAKLDKEISRSKKETLDDSDISECSTPVNLEDRIPSSDYDSNVGSSVFDASPEVEMNNANDGASLSECACSNCRLETDHVPICSNKGKCLCNYLDEACENMQDLSFKKAKFHEIMQKLLDETERYAKLNARESLLCKEKDNLIRKFQKERDDFNKYQEAEKQKLEAYVKEERLQMKRQKDSFMRFQKLSKDFPTRKERDQLNALHLDMEKSKEELKRQKIKYNNECRKWKSRIDNAEKERDALRLENMALKTENEDLLAALKARRKKNIKSSDGDCGNVENNETVKHIVEKKDAECQTEAKELSLNVFQDSNQSSPKSGQIGKAKSKANFSSVAGFEENVDIADTGSDNHAAGPSRNANCHPEENDLVNEFGSNDKENAGEAASDVNLSVISVSNVADFIKIVHIYPTGEREIIFNVGTRKVISADGKSVKVTFYNGDTKEKLPDGRVVYTYINNGAIETKFPDGVRITQFPDGQIQHLYPDGRKKVKYPNGTEINIFTDGSSECRTPDNKLVKEFADGRKVTQLPNGQTDIKTSSYRRREFPDGSVKIVHSSGNQETRFSNGRVKIKDKDGKVVFDTKHFCKQKG